MTLVRFAVACALVLAGDVTARAQEIRFGVLPRLSATELTAMFTPIADHVASRTGRKVRLVLAKDFDSFERQVREGEIDLGFANSLIYVQLKRDVNLTPLALAAEKKGGTRFRGIIIVRRDSGFADVAGLKGKRLIFVDENSLGGYIAQALLLRKQGLDVKRDFVLLPFAKKHDNVTMAVFNRAADAGGIREDDLEKMAGKVDLSQIKVLAYSDYFPNWPFFAGPRMDPATRDAVRSALLELRGGGRQLDAAHLTALTTVADKDYDGLREAARVVGAF